MVGTGKVADFSGFTLVELLLVIMIVTIMLSVAVPKMTHLIHSNSTYTEAARLMAAINLTRSEAVSSNAPTSMCPSPVEATGELVCSGNYADGWIVFKNSTLSRSFDPELNRVIQVAGGLASGYTITNRAGTRAAAEWITYYPDGSSPRNRTLLICPPDGRESESRSIVMNIVGRPRLTRDWGDCPGG